MKWRRVIIVASLLFYTQGAAALYIWQDEQSRGDARLLLRGFVVASHKPANPPLNDQQDDQAMGGLMRLIAQSHYQQNWLFEFNAYQTYISKSLVSQGRLGTALDVERSGALEWSVTDDEYAHLAIDRLNAHWSSNLVDITVGRQPINLATTFFFSPNDFFAPFAAQTFYRVYKPGVDAVRGEIALGELSSFSVIAVQGYQPLAGSVSGWGDEPAAERNSYLARYIANLAGFEWGLITGKVRRSRILGGSLSGELFNWLGVRAEGHRLDTLDDDVADQARFSLGLEHRWENSLMVQVEQYYNGAGAMEVAKYDMQQAYPARRYQALGISYEFTPLLSGQFTIVHNPIDHSVLYSLNAIYSLANESELAVSLTVPGGKGATGSNARSEFGSYPSVLNIEIRAYF